MVETEYTEEEERDLQSTERFELKNETEDTVTAEGNLRSGDAFSPSYGSMLEFQGGTDSPVAGSQSQSSRQASNYSREVTSRSASKVTERVKKQVTLRKLREFEEKTGHTFDDSAAGGANVNGVYHWVEKALRGKSSTRPSSDVRYHGAGARGLRPTGDHRQLAGRNGTDQPAPFTLGIDNISEWDYSIVAASYGAPAWSRLHSSGDRLYDIRQPQPRSHHQRGNCR